MNKSEINKILVISLTNIGDVILTFPVIDILKEDFPSAELSVVIGPKAESLLYGNPHLKHVYIFDKHQPPLQVLSWVLGLRRERFDLVVDLRNTAIPFMISSRYRTSCRVKKISDPHMRKKHLAQLRSVYAAPKDRGQNRTLFVTQADKDHVQKLIANEIGQGRKYIVVAPGAADSSKRWPLENFADVCAQLDKEFHFKTVFIGDEQDRPIARKITEKMEVRGVNLCGRTNLIQLAELLEHCLFALVNDSAPMHLASYLDVPLVALFGPSDPDKYGPWGANGCMIKKNADCLACAKKTDAGPHQCMAAISPGEVFSAVKTLIQ